MITQKSDYHDILYVLKGELCTVLLLACGEYDLHRRAEEGHRAREPSGDPEADAGPGALEAVHHVSDVEAALSQ